MALSWDEIVRNSGRLLEHPISARITIRLEKNVTDTSVTQNTDADGFKYDHDLLALIHDGYYNDEDEGQFDCD